MQGISTLTQKGQIAIPKAIRDHFNLKTSDKLRFYVENNQIVAEPIKSVREMRGFIKAQRPVSLKEMREAIIEAVVKKHANHS
jgi:antitoxin PrlF